MVMKPSLTSRAKRSCSDLSWLRAPAGFELRYNNCRSILSIGAILSTSDRVVGGISKALSVSDDPALFPPGRVFVSPADRDRLPSLQTRPLEQGTDHGDVVVPCYLRPMLR